jgi:hypothetical protein
MRRSREVEARATYALLQKAAPVVFVLGVVGWVLGAITPLNLIVTSVVLIALIVGSTWQLRRPTPLIRRRTGGPREG